MSKTKDKLEKLIQDNQERAKRVEEMVSQIAALREAINTIKEEHDFTRGQIVALEELLNEEPEKDAEPVK